MTPFQKILVPVDFSSHSAKALEVGLDLAKRFDAALGVVHVHQPVTDSFTGGFMLPMSAVAASTTLVLSGLETLLTKAGQQARAAGVSKVETKLLEGVPFTEIARFARTAGYDLIVVGTHGRTGIAHALLGSVAERVVRKAHCAVLAVRLAEQDAGQA